MPAISPPASPKPPISFGTTDLALILARITRGLRRAVAFEARIIEQAAQLDKASKPQSASAAAASAPCPPGARRPRKPSQGEADAALLVHLPTEKEIAEEVRRRPIGSVLADICRDLGIDSDHPLWPELQDAIMDYGGGLIALGEDRGRRPLQTRASFQRAYAAGTIPPRPTVLPYVPAAASTGPP